MNFWQLMLILRRIFKKHKFAFGHNLFISIPTIKYLLYLIIPMYFNNITSYFFKSLFPTGMKYCHKFTKHMKEYKGCNIIFHMSPNKINRNSRSCEPDQCCMKIAMGT